MRSRGDGQAMKPLVEAFLAILASLIATTVCANLQPIFPIPLAILFGCLAAGIVWLILYGSIFFLRRASRRMRSWLDHRAIVDGFWIEHLVPGDYVGSYSILLFTYNVRRDTYNLTGWNFDDAGNEVRTFYASNVATVIGSEDSVHYYYEGTRKADQKIIKGIGHFTFRDSGGNGIDSAGGMFADNEEKAAPIAVQLSRIRDTDAQTYANVSLEMLSRTPHRTQFVKGYHSHNGGRRKGHVT